MTKTIAKLGQKITVASNASERAIAATVAAARGDNATVTATTLERVILRASASNADLIDAVRNCQHSQKEVQVRAFAARWYAMDYMDAVKAGKVKEARDQSGNVIIPAMDDATRRTYAALLEGAAPDAKTLKEKQVRCTADQWQRKSTLRTWWTRLLFAAGVKTMEKRGGARVKKGRTKIAKGAKSTTQEIDARTNRLPARNEQGGFAMPAIVNVETPADAGEFYMAMATTLVKFTSANVKSKASAPFVKLVNAFHRDVMALAKKLKK